MNKFGQILLISCYELGHQPLGIALPSAFLQRAGFLPDAIDLSVEKLEINKVKRARFIGISVPMHTALRIGREVADRIRQINPSCHVSFYGLYASLNQEALLKSVADSVIGGEYETPLLSLVQSLEKAGTDPIAGVHTQSHSAKPLLAHLPFPTPSRDHLPPLTHYAHLIENRSERKVGYVEASRGCRHRCRHCPIPPVYGGRFFILPQEIVLEDIQNLVAMGATHITFGDPDFLNGPIHSLRIVRLLDERFPNVTFDFTAKVEHLIKYQALLPELAAFGCLFIVSAVESMNDTVLQYLDKAHTRADVIQVFRLVKKAGMALRPSLVPFTPWTSFADLCDLLETIEEEGMIYHVDPIQYTIRLLIPPGSLLLSEPTIVPVLGPLDETRFSYLWSHPERQIDKIQETFRLEVERSLEMGTATETIFYQLKEYLNAARDMRSPMTIQAASENSPKHPPRLSEPWFCCAEPMAEQLFGFEEADKRLP